MSVTIRAQAILLDMDGTLVDSSAVVERIWREWASEHSLDPAEVLAIVHGRQSHESMAILLPERPVEENLAEHWAMAARETADTEHIAEIAGAAALLESLASLPHALVTSATVPLARVRMEAAGLSVPTIAVTAENVRASKPHPEGFLAGASALDVAPDECVAFEDSDAGITAAHRAGMRVIGVGAGAVQHGADWTVPDLSGVQVTADEEGLTITLSQVV